MRGTHPPRTPPTGFFAGAAVPTLATGTATGATSARATEDMERFLDNVRGDSLRSPAAKAMMMVWREGS